MSRPPGANLELGQATRHTRGVRQQCCLGLGDRALPGWHASRSVRHRASLSAALSITPSLYLKTENEISWAVMNSSSAARPFLVSSMPL